MTSSNTAPGDTNNSDALYDDACMKLFHKIRSGHCLYDILPPENGQHYDMRRRAHTFVLPQCIPVIF